MIYDKNGREIKKGHYIKVSLSSPRYLIKDVMYYYKNSKDTFKVKLECIDIHDKSTLFGLFTNDEVLQWACAMTEDEYILEAL